MVEFRLLTGTAGNDSRVAAYLFERNGRVYVVCWHTSGKGIVRIALPPEAFTYREELFEKVVVCERAGEGALLPLSNSRYFCSAMDVAETEKLFDATVYIDEINE